MSLHHVHAEARAGHRSSFSIDNHYCIAVRQDLPLNQKIRLSARLRYVFFTPKAGFMVMCIHADIFYRCWGVKLSFASRTAMLTCEQSF